LQAVAISTNGTVSAPSNEAQFTTLAQPVLTSAVAYGPTTGLATATPPPGVNYTQWIFTATPSGGGPAVNVTSPTPEARFYGLTPNTTVGGSPAARSPPCMQLLALCLSTGSFRVSTCHPLRLPVDTSPTPALILCACPTCPPLPASLQYVVTAVGVLPDGRQVATVNQLSFKTPAPG